MIEVIGAGVAILACFGAGWRVAVRHDWWDRPSYEHQKAHISVPGLIDYEVHPYEGGNIT